MTRRMFRKQMLAMCLAAVSAGVTSSAPAQDYKRTNLFGNASTTVTPVRAGSAVSGPARTTVREVSIEDRQQQELNQLVAEAVKITSRRYLSADVHTPWQILHGILALRSEYQIKVDGQKSSALEWLANASSYQGTPMVESTAYGGLFHPFTTPYAFEGHPNQFLAIVTMSDLPASYVFTTKTGAKVTIEDMLKNAQMDVNDREEITWTLWAMARYLPTDSEWANKYGEPWSIERLVQIQTRAEVNSAACGGTHGLFALSLARNAALAAGRPLRGVWMEADQKIKRYISTTRSLQNGDGTFSSNYFAAPGYSTEFGKRIATSGHILEFLMVGASQQDMQQKWLQDGIRAVATDLIEHRKEPADCGPLYHALHSLVLYQQRIGYVDPTENVPVEPSVTVTTEPSGQPETGASGSTTPELKSVPDSPPASGPAPRQIATEPEDSQRRAEIPRLTVPDETPILDVATSTELFGRPASRPIAGSPDAPSLLRVDGPTEPAKLLVDDPLLPKLVNEQPEEIGLFEPPVANVDELPKTDSAAAKFKPLTKPRSPQLPSERLASERLASDDLLNTRSNRFGESKRVAEAVTDSLSSVSAKSVVIARSKPVATRQTETVTTSPSAASATRVRTPEDNAPVIRSEPVIMDDGYEIPLPPTED